MCYCKLHKKAKSLQVPPTGAFSHHPTTSGTAVSFISATDTSTYPASVQLTLHLICRHVRIEARYGITLYNSSAFFLQLWTLNIMCLNLYFPKFPFFCLFFIPLAAIYKTCLRSNWVMYRDHRLDSRKRSARVSSFVAAWQWNLLLFILHFLFVFLLCFVPVCRERWQMSLVTLFL